MNLTGKAHQDPLASSGGIRGKSDGISQIARTIGCGVGSPAHGTGEDHATTGRNVPEEQIAQVGRLLHGVGAVGDHDSLGGFTECLAHLPGDLEHVLGLEC
jgi:hypothetical protein